ncbi:MAG: cobalamin-binding protein, partial [Chloroflexi bacterium]|nr:cobalamin-binding protein [Chloroflexota bacterium]
MQRIVSLIPSATEIVSALGFREQLVGRSHECDFPPGVETLPICTSPKLSFEGSSAEIDRAVKQALSEAIAVYDIKQDVLEDLAPTMVIT